MQHFYKKKITTLTAVKISRRAYLRCCGYIPEMSGRVAWFRSAQARRVHRRDEALHTDRKQQNPEKAGLKQRLNPFMWGLFLCCDWRMHVWTPTVSKCWFKGCKSAASKQKGFKNSFTSPLSSRQYESESDFFFLSIFPEFRSWGDDGSRIFTLHGISLRLDFRHGWLHTAWF